MSAPAASLTVPRIVPVGSWARAEEATPTSTNHKEIHTVLLIDSSSVAEVRNAAFRNPSGWPSGQRDVGTMKALRADDRAAARHRSRWGIQATGSGLRGLSRPEPGA